MAMANSKDTYTNDELIANGGFSTKHGDVYVKKVTRYVLVRAESRKMVFPDGRKLPGVFEEVDLGEFRRKDEADKAAAALNAKVAVVGDGVDTVAITKEMRAAGLVKVNKDGTYSITPRTEAEHLALDELIRKSRKI
jgi:hypothetical protein